MWPLILVGLVVAVLGVAVAREPEEGRKFFARSRGMFHGTRETNRIASIPAEYFRLSGYGLAGTGLFLAVGGIAGF